MQVTYHFRSAADWSNPEQGTALIEALSETDLTVEKVGTADPPHLPFDPSAGFWAGNGLPGFHTTGDFYFRGGGIGKFKGSVAWNRDLPIGTQHYNTLSLHLTVRREIDTTRLIDLGDRLFAWSKPVFGLITGLGDLSPQARPPAARLYLPGLYWVNYFALLHYTALRFPGDAVTLLPLGLRVTLASHPEDPEVGRRAESLKAALGTGWFAEGPSGNWALPDVDFSALWRGGRET